MTTATELLKRLARGMLGAALMVGGVVSTASPQWMVINLHPTGATASHANGIDGGLQAGDATVGGWPHAAAWSGSAASWVDLDPAGSTQSKVWGAGSGQQAGFAYVPAYGHAGLWRGTRDSWVDLNPTGVITSAATDASGDQQVGIVSFNSNWRASLWTGSADTWVNLDPHLSSWSEAWGVNGGQQVGRTRVSGATRASLWSGSAASWVDLHPAGAGSSMAFDVDAGQQVGYADFSGHRACLWTGTSASWVDLHPIGTQQSEAIGVHAGQQVGYATVAFAKRASLWTGSAASWVDLQAVLPTEFNESEARAVTHGANTYVVGWGYNTVTQREEALLWVGPLPAAGVDPSEQAGALRLIPGRPNPFVGETCITYSAATEGHLRIEILDVSGRRMATLLDGVQPAGTGQVRWNAAEVPAGIYYCRLGAGDALLIQKLVVLK